jgi:predicted glutamine amidotransferase
MCGIFSVLSSSSKAVNGAEEFIRDALIAGAVRGTDSCGLAIVNADLSIEQHKDVLAPTSFLTSRATESLLKGADTAYVVIGHNRAATIGKVCVDAAHPHYTLGISKEEVGCMGVHNGTLRNHKLKDGGREFISDSEWLFSSLADVASNFKDAKQRTEQVAEFLDDPTTVYSANNGERPLSLLPSKDNSFFVMASEADMLYWLAKRNGMDVSDTVFNMAKDVLYTFDVNTADAKIVHGKRDIKPQPTTTAMTYTKPTQPVVTTYTPPYRSAAERLADMHARHFGASTDVSVDDSDVPLETMAFLLDGLSVEFMINEVDNNLRQAYGVYWPSDSEDIEGLFGKQIKSFLAKGSFVIDGIDKNTMITLGLNSSVVYIGTVHGARLVSERDTKTGKYIDAPYAVIKSEFQPTTEQVLASAS